jgi:cathepsin X
MLSLMFALPAAKIFHGHVRQTRPVEALEFVTGVRPEHALAHEDIPASLDWRNVDGVSYVTADVNQHIPQYCGGCWIHGTLAALNDRIKMARKAAFPDVMLARQVVVNCVPPHNKSEAPPGCNGGDPFLIHHYMKHKSIPDETCQPYEAKNGVCDDMGTCRNCLPSPNIVGKDCWAMPSYVRYSVSEYGSVSGEKAMQKEILARGPIVCSLAADEQFMFEFGKVIAEHDGNIDNIHMSRQSPDFTELTIDLEVYDLKHLSAILLRKITNLDCVAGVCVQHLFS